MHIVKLIHRRFPEHGSTIITTLLVLAGSGIAIGIGLLLLLR
jgi:hypothetical protein